jgi:hypothetical protein
LTLDFIEPSPASMRQARALGRLRRAPRRPLLDAEESELDAVPPRRLELSWRRQSDRLRQP